MSDADRKAVTTRRVLLVGLLLVLVGAAFPFHSRPTTELPVYVQGAARMLVGEPIYRTNDTKPFTYPPFFAVPFVPMTLLPEAALRPTWYGVNAGALLLLVWVLARASPAARGPSRTQLCLWGGVAVLAGRHVASVFENQSHDLLIGLLVALGADAWRRARDLRAGAWLGLAAACKATPLLFLVPLALRRRARAALALGTIALALTLLPDLLLPRREGGLWVMAWYDSFLKGLSAGGTADADGAWLAGSFMNQSLSGTLHRLCTVDTTVNEFVRNVAVADLPGRATRAVTLVAQLAIVLWLAWLMWRARPRAAHATDTGAHRFGVAAATACGMVLLSPMSSKAHFCVLALPAAFCMQTLLETRDGALRALLLAQGVLSVATIKGVLGSERGNWMLAYGCVTWMAVLALAATSRALTLEARATPR